MRDIITDELKKIEVKENVKILLAVESGSRAWGFASPDSDYDVRFIYVREKQEYMKLEKVRDVIEWKLDETLDINGWDIRKALSLLYKSNPTMFEWCASPVVYIERPEFQLFRDLLPKYFSLKRVLYHYYSMANSNYREYLKGDEVRVKKYFYVLRPLLAAKWIMDKNEAPPIVFETLAKRYLGGDVKEETEKLLEIKRKISEIGVAPRVDVINEYIENELPKAKKAADDAENKKVQWKTIDDVFEKLAFEMKY